VGSFAHNSLTRRANPASGHELATTSVIRSILLVYSQIYPLGPFREALEKCRGLFIVAASAKLRGNDRPSKLPVTRAAFSDHALGWKPEREKETAARRARARATRPDACSFRAVGLAASKINVGA